MNVREVGQSTNVEESEKNIDRGSEEYATLSAMTTRILIPEGRKSCVWLKNEAT